MISKQFAKRRKDSAVSPVIATILMVAITVVLAAVLYVMVGGFTHNPGTANSVGMSPTNETYGWNVQIVKVSSSTLPISSITYSLTATNGTTIVSGSFSGATFSSTNPTAKGVYLIYSGTAPTDLGVAQTIVIYHEGAASGSTLQLFDGNSELGTITLQ